MATEINKLPEWLSSGQLAWPTLAVLATSIVVYYHLKLFTFWSSRGIQGPRPWPIFGTNIYYLYRNKVELDLEWRQRYGHTYGIYEGYWPTLRTSDNEILKHVYIKQFNSFTDRNHKIVHGDQQRRWLLWSEGQYWSNQRALVSPMFTSAKMRLMMTKMSECIDSFIMEASRRLEEAKRSLVATTADEDSHDEVAEQRLALKAADRAKFSREDLMALTLDVIAQSFFSIKIDTYQDKANKFLLQAYDFARFDLWRFFVFSLVPGPVARLFQFDLTPQWRFDYFDRLSQSMIDERRRKRPATDGDTSVSSPTNKNDIIQALLEAKIPDQYEKIYTKEDDKESHYNDQLSHEELEKIQESQSKGAKLFRSFSDSEIRGSMTFFFLAGFETTASAISFCMYELAHQPAAQQEVYEELCQKIGHHDRDKSIDYSDLLDLKKLDGLVSEVLRLYSPLLENNRIVTHQEGATVPTKPKPIHLPPGVSISTNFYTLHRDEDYFDQPDQFQLHRFYPENRHKIKSCTYAPFGLGPRACAGTRFALLEIKLCLAKLLLRYLVEPGASSSNYPPKYKQNAIFLQFETTDFKLVPRS